MENNSKEKIKKKFSLRAFVKRHPVLTYWLLSVIFVIIIIPFGIWVMQTYPNVFDDLRDVAGGRATTNILYEFPHLLKVDGGMYLFLFLLLQPAMPLIAALITALLLGKERMKDLVSRWRFWSKEVGWKKGILIWIIAIVSFSIISSLGTGIMAYINKEAFTWPDFKFIADIFSPTFWFLFITSLFFDGGGLLEETGWRGFLLPELQRRYAPLKAAIGVGVLWSLWHIPVKIEEIMNDFPNFLHFYICFTLGCILLSIIISYFYNKLGGSTFIAIALHGLNNDSSGLTGGFNGIGGNLINSAASSRIFEMLSLIPPLILVVIILWIDSKNLGLKPSEKKNSLDNSSK